MPVFIQSQHLDWNVPRGWILFQMVQHRPAQHVWQEDIQRNRGGMEFARQSESFRPAHRDQHLESFVARQIAKHSGIVGVILHNQQDSIVRLQIGPVVADTFDLQLGGQPLPIAAATS